MAGIVASVLYLPFVVTASVLGALAAIFIAGRWVRVAQREHYVPGSVSRMAWLWLRREPGSGPATAVVIVAIAVAVLVPIPALQALPLPAIVLLGLLPFGLGFRGTSKPLAVTSRVKRLLVVWIVLHLAVGVALTLLLGPAGPALTLLLSAPLTDLALAIMSPIEKSASQRYVAAAKKRLAQVRPTVVAITGSYGKTSTKNYVAHLLSATFTTVASPASFNNRLGLARSVNDKLVPGTEMFVAEMGMDAPGQIAELCEHFPPDIAAITVIGEGHLQRMRTTDAILQEKSTITDRARTVVLPIDDARLAALAASDRMNGKRVVTVSCVPGTDADVVLSPASGDAGATIVLGRGGEPVPVTIASTGHAVNVAVASGIALAAGVPGAVIASRLGALPGSQHRAEVQQSPSGALVIDDTYNANPVGSLRALESAAALAAERGGPLVVVTPGMVELGPVQAERNHAFGAAIGAVGARLFAVARTNRAALLAGYASTATAEALGADAVRSREHAVAEAVTVAGERGVILYENDLPDHYP
ncbi:Mur ligase family protein [Microcella indica]|uniref:Mur ligase family protein n=1 Tax=Microcella indica TaxID=2750620 RepID=UPI0015CF7F24|nr:Mur ligase family protein [Microcella indica]